MFTKEDLDQKGKEYNVPDEINILEPIEADKLEIDSFDQILSNLGSVGSVGSDIEGVRVADDNNNEKDIKDGNVKVLPDSDKRSTHILNAIHPIHPIQNQDYKAVSKAKLDATTVDSNKHDIYWAGSQWYCNNCNLHGDKPYMTKETSCKGESKDSRK